MISDAYMLVHIAVTQLFIDLSTTACINKVSFVQVAILSEAQGEWEVICFKVTPILRYYGLIMRGKFCNM